MKCMKFSTLLVSSIIFFSCSKKVSTQTTPNLVGPWEVGAILLTEDMVSFSLKNTTDTPLVLHKPMDKAVSFAMGEGWENISILYCDCGTTCPPPPERLTVEPKGSYIFSWDLFAEECISEERTMRTVKTKMSTGKYMVSLKYSLPNSREKIDLEVPFTID